MKSKTETAEPALRNEHVTFEQWAGSLADALRAYYKKHGYELPKKIRHLPGFTSKGKRGRIKGECWPAVASDDQTVEIFVQGDLDDPREVAGVIVHEHLHAMLPLDAGHGKLFEKAALRIGLDTEQGLLHARPGKVLQTEIIDPILADLGPIPRKKLNFKMFNIDGKEIAPADKAKKQSTRNRKAHCTHESGCGYTLLITTKWVDATEYGPPTCPKHGTRLQVDPVKEAENDAGGTPEAGSEDQGTGAEDVRELTAMPEGAGPDTGP